MMVCCSRYLLVDIMLTFLLWLFVLLSIDIFFCFFSLDKLYVFVILFVSNWTACRRKFHWDLVNLNILTVARRVLGTDELSPQFSMTKFCMLQKTVGWAYIHRVIIIVMILVLAYSSCRGNDVVLVFCFICFVFRVQGACNTRWVFKLLLSKICAA